MVNVYALYDSVADEFLMPFFQKNDKCALRAYDKFCSMPENAGVAKDFNLFCLGSYDNSNGAITGLESPRAIKLTDLLTDDE